MIQVPGTADVQVDRGDFLARGSDSGCAIRDLLTGRTVPTMFGALVYSRRRSLRWSRGKLAKIASVHRESIKALEEGKRPRLHAGTISRIVEALAAGEQWRQFKVGTHKQAAPSGNTADGGDEGERRRARRHGRADGDCRI